VCRALVARPSQVSLQCSAGEPGVNPPVRAAAGLGFPTLFKQTGFQRQKHSLEVTMQNYKTANTGENSARVCINIYLYIHIYIRIDAYMHVCVHTYTLYSLEVAPQNNEVLNNRGNSAQKHRRYAYLYIYTHICIYAYMYIRLCK